MNQKGQAGGDRCWVAIEHQREGGRTGAGCRDPLILAVRESTFVLRLKRVGEAHVRFQRALELRRQLASDKSNVDAQFSVAESKGDLGAWRCAAGDASEGESNLSALLLIWMNSSDAMPLP